MTNSTETARPERPVERRVGPDFEALARWAMPRPPLMRLCTLKFTCNAWPDDGRGVWEILGYRDMDTKNEAMQLRRVMPAKPGGSTGECIWFHRSTYELGGMDVWRADLSDPRFARPNESEAK
jgi:hypothetical protein